MKNIIISVISILLAATLSAQSFNIGQTTIIFVDPARNNRNISTEIFYPSTSSGSNVPVAEGIFPVLSFGHGFLMNYDAYSVYWEDLVPKGYIMVLPKTETGFAPDHQNFALDLAFVVQAMKAEGTNPASLFYQKVATESSLMGHSMGGGCAYLAAAADTTITSVVSLAASVETNPPALPVAAGLTLPSLIFSGQNDSVTPFYSNQLPLYQTLLSDCKTYISINGGAHCYFGNENQICDLGELLSGSNPTISREEQHEVVFTFLGFWLDYTLKGDVSAFANFQDSLYTSGRITFLNDCLTTSVNNPLFQDDWVVFPNPFSDVLNIRNLKDYLVPNFSLRIYDYMGHLVYSGNRFSDKNFMLDLGYLPDGFYIIQITGIKDGFSKKVVKQMD